MPKLVELCDCDEMMIRVIGDTGSCCSDQVDRAVNRAAGVVFSSSLVMVSAFPPTVDMLAFSVAERGSLRQLSLTWPYGLGHATFHIASKMHEDALDAIPQCSQRADLCVLHATISLEDLRQSFALTKIL